MWKHHFRWDYCSAQRCEDVELDDTQCSEAYGCFISTQTYVLKAVAELGDPVDDLSVATVLMVVGGQLILLRPRKVQLLSDENFSRQSLYPIVSGSRGQL